MKWMRSAVAIALAMVLGMLARKLAHVPPAATDSRTLVIAPGSIDPERVTDVMLDRDGVHFHFERQGDSWMQTEPVSHPVDAWAVRQFVSRLLKAESVRTVHARSSDSASGGATLAEAGLAPAVGRIEIRERAADAASAPRTTIVELGARGLAGRAYARVIEPPQEADTFDVVDSTLHEYALERDPKDLRRRELFVDLGDVDQLTLSSGAMQQRQNVVISRKGRDYRIEEPIHARADRVACEELFDALKRARSSGFIIDNPAQLDVYGLAPAAATLVVESEGKRRELRIGSEVSIGAQDRFGMLEGTQSVVRVGALELASIIPKVDRLVDAVATGVRSRDVGAIEIASAAGRLKLKRELNAWSAIAYAAADAPAGEQHGSVDTAAVDRLLSALTTARAGSIEIGAYPSDAEIARVTLFGFADEPLDTVRVARRASDRNTILENGDGVLRIHGQLEAPLDAHELGFAAKR